MGDDLQERTSGDRLSRRSFLARLGLLAAIGIAGSSLLGIDEAEAGGKKKKHAKKKRPVFKKKKKRVVFKKKHPVFKKHPSKFHPVFKKKKRTKRW